MAFTADARAKLPPKHLELLTGASASVVEFMLEDVVNLSGEEPADGEDLQTPPWLPARFAEKYDRAFLVRLMACAVVVGHKITAPHDSTLACVGEEIAFHVAVCVCPVCGQETPATYDPDDPEALRLSPATYAHFNTHLPLVSTTGIPMEGENPKA